MYSCRAHLPPVVGCVLSVFLPDPHLVCGLGYEFLILGACGHDGEDLCSHAWYSGDIVHSVRRMAMGIEDTQLPRERI